MRDASAIQFAMEDEEEPAEQSAWLTEFPALKVALKEHLMPLEGEHPDVRCGRDDVKRVIGTSVASALLYASARDAMSGFLLGGAADQTLAALAEDCVRNASRKEAKDFFWQSRMSASGSSNMATFVSVFEGGNFRLPLQWERSFKMYFPRAWTVNMYLQSFEPLYLALEVYAEDNIVGSAAIRRTAALLSVSDDSSSLIDIDDDAVVDGATDIAQFSHLLPHGSRLKEHDGLAHRLLCCLVEALVFTSREMVDARDKESNGTPAVDVDTATLLPFSSAEQNPISSSECGKGLLECLRLLYAFTDAVPMAAVSELPLPHRLPLGVLLSVQLGNAADRGEIGVEDGCGETCLVPHVNFRLSAELKSRIRSVKEQAEEESSDDESDTGEGSVSNSRDTSGSDESSSTAEEHSISAPILSRLLSVISTIAHLCGDDVGAHRCLSAAVALSAEESGSRHCHDSRLKMACLLLEMHEFDEVSSLLMLHFADASNTSRRLISQAETYFEVNVPEADPGTFSELVTMMHKAELQVHKFDYEAAASRIRYEAKHCVVLQYSTDIFKLHLY